MHYSQYPQMIPLSQKELDYISDCISNEDMLLKLCVAASATAQNPDIGQTLTNHVRTHEHHLHMLTESLRQHQSLAPTQQH